MPFLTDHAKADPKKARIYRSNGWVENWVDGALAYAVWLAAPKGCRLAFRAAGDTRPVYSQDYVDKL